MLTSQDWASHGLIEGTAGVSEQLQELKLRQCEKTKQQADSAGIFPW